jgi:hypothetical protein
MDMIKVVKSTTPSVKVTPATPTLALHFTGAVQTGWQQGTGTNLAAGTKIYIGPSSGTPDSPATNDIWIQTG